MVHVVADGWEPMRILVINAGSSSLKWQYFDGDQLVIDENIQRWNPADGFDEIVEAVTAAGGVDAPSAQADATLPLAATTDMTQVAETTVDPQKLASVDTTQVDAGATDSADSAAVALPDDGRPLDQLAVGELASGPVVTVRPSDQLGDAMALLLRQRVHRLVVVEDNGQVRGILEALDLFSFLANHSHLITVQIEHAQDLRLVGHVGLHRDGVATRGANGAHHLVGGQRVGGVVHRHGVTLPGGQQSGGRPNAARATGNQDNGLHAGVL